MRRSLLVGFLALALGCTSSDAVSGTGGQGFSPDPPLTIGTDERPADVDIPTDYDPSQSYPLVMVLHGRGTTGRVQTGYLQLFDFVDPKQFILLFPDGTISESGESVWNGAVCCADDDSVDDVGYLSGLIDEALQTYHIDPKRVYLVGHSNGGFMAFRMACEVPERFTALVSLAGGTYADPADCQPGTPPVSVLVVHGTADDTVAYEGGIFESDDPEYAYAGAVEIVERSAASAGCDPESSSDLGSIDLIPAVEGDETDRKLYASGCEEGLDTELWTMNEGSHVPFFQPLDSGKPLFPDLITDWLFRHSR